LPFRRNGGLCARGDEQKRAKKNADKVKAGTSGQQVDGADFCTNASMKPFTAAAGALCFLLAINAAGTRKSFLSTSRNGEMTMDA
jgi:hypothetical protein